MSQNENRDKTPSLTDKEHSLLEALTALGSALVAFSGGVDSTYLAWAARRVLGDRALAVTSVCPLVPLAEVVEARRLAAFIGIAHEEIEAVDLSAEYFRTHPPDRCYHCKRDLFLVLRRLAELRGIQHLLAGDNLDDARGHRPGRRAATELGVRHPLQDAGLTKTDIRQLSARIPLPTADKPSRACLATRIPYGTPVTAALLARVEQAEDFLLSLGIRQVRFRHHGDLCRIEVAPEGWAILFPPAMREKVVKFMKEIGYQYVTLDLAGYRSGAMDEILDHSAKGRRV
ncbi:MAG: ATP-dependent sacrificial sulfur transferase LarE [Acidobacteria bacterium]|nr:ATP-dependent sacrificial sulfur transferase LarE [Acidobacteriota bacterium]